MELVVQVEIQIQEKQEDPAAVAAVAAVVEREALLANLHVKEILVLLDVDQQLPVEMLVEVAVATEALALLLLVLL